ncbi:HEPN domain-containing protein [Kytococcus sedentarius]|uniref:HEPN domain-containing protein n=1 Tax=Kytococcus sedentarius TaxID=1276 RepID=UPI00384B27EE
MPEPIEQMLRARRLERVEPNPGHALSVVQMAERHVETARVLAGMNDPAMAFTAAYDGARKALAAVLAVEGLRVRPAGGAHRNTGLAAAAFVHDASLEDFEWMRQVRNATEYPDLDRPTATHQDVVEAIDAAGAIVGVCAAHVRDRG